MIKTERMVGRVRITLENPASGHALVIDIDQDICCFTVVPHDGMSFAGEFTRQDTKRLVHRLVNILHESHTP